MSLMKLVTVLRRTTPVVFCSSYFLHPNKPISSGSGFKQCLSRIYTVAVNPPPVNRVINPREGTKVIRPWEEDHVSRSYDDDDICEDHDSGSWVNGSEKLGDDGLPISIDWRKKGAVTPIQNQHGQGTCWALCATAAIEGVNKIVTGELVKLSEQQLIDCNCIGNSGCVKGTVTDAFDYVIRNGGLVQESDYPYLARQNDCRRITAQAVTIDDYWWGTNISENCLKWAVSRQPTCVMVLADRRFVNYRGGILDGPNYSLDELNHFITIVAYDSENGKDYWTGKNSWGELYGENGYIRIARGTGAFGIARIVSFPMKWSPNRICIIKSDKDMLVKKRF